MGAHTPRTSFQRTFNKDVNENLIAFTLHARSKKRSSRPLWNINELFLDRSGLSLFLWLHPNIYFIRKIRRAHTRDQASLYGLRLKSESARGWWKGSLLQKLHHTAGAIHHFPLGYIRDVIRSRILIDERKYPSKTPHLHTHTSILKHHKTARNIYSIRIQAAAALGYREKKKKKRITPSVF